MTTGDQRRGAGSRSDRHAEAPIVQGDGYEGAEPGDHHGHRIADLRQHRQPRQHQRHAGGAVRQRIGHGGAEHEHRHRKDEQQHDARQRHALTAGEELGEQPARRDHGRPDAAGFELPVGEIAERTEEQREADGDEDVAETGDEAQPLIVVRQCCRGRRGCGREFRLQSP
jgi:hypothetical protein